MTPRLLRAISDRLPCRIIADNGQAYLERYFLGQAFGATFYLHRFVGSDPDRGLHCHPWGWARSIILSGWYLEETRAGTRPVRWYNRLTGDTFHRVILPFGRREVWTLFFHGRYVKAWGFWRKEVIWSDAGPVLGATWRPHVPSTNEATGREQWWKRAPRGRDCPGRVV
jgi:hypothetical protein